MQNKIKVHLCFKEEDRKCHEEIITLPFKPENGDLLNLDTGPDAPDGKRYCTIQLTCLVYDTQNEYWSSRPDIYRGLDRKRKIMDEDSQHEGDLLP